MVGVRMRHNHGVYTSDPSLGKKPYQSIAVATVYDGDGSTAINDRRVAMAYVYDPSFRLFGSDRCQVLGRIRRI